MSEIPETTAIFPDYQDEANYEAIIQLCPAGERGEFKPFEETRALTLEAAEAGRRDGQDFTFILVAADQWRAWCEEQGRPCKHAEIFPYVTWLRRSALSDVDLTESGSDAADVLPNDE
ncbi:MAG: hypothetical protein EOP87_23015 [Verrucomicrobiaceae bacterium]|nr:MAG: hypothetical protein EOP87_23015 [Verrucomicrobiaceae bacterium]